MIPIQNYQLYQYKVEPNKDLLKLFSREKYDFFFSLNRTNTDTYLKKITSMLSKKKAQSILKYLNEVDRIYNKEYNRKDASMDEIYINYYFRKKKWIDKDQNFLQNKQSYIINAIIEWDSLPSEQKEEWYHQKALNDEWWNKMEKTGLEVSSLDCNLLSTVVSSFIEKNTMSAFIKEEKITEEENIAYNDIIEFIGGKYAVPESPEILFIRDRYHLIGEVSKKQIESYGYSEWIETTKEEKKRYYDKYQQQYYLYTYCNIVNIKKIISTLDTVSKYGNKIHLKEKRTYSLSKENQFRDDKKKREENMKNDRKNKSKDKINKNTGKTKDNGALVPSHSLIDQFLSVSFENLFLTVDEVLDTMKRQNTNSQKKVSNKSKGQQTKEEKKDSNKKKYEDIELAIEREYPKQEEKEVALFEQDLYSSFDSNFYSDESNLQIPLTLDTFKYQTVIPNDESQDDNSQYKQNKKEIQLSLEAIKEETNENKEPEVKIEQQNENTHLLIPNAQVKKEIQIPIDTKDELKDKEFENEVKNSNTSKNESQEKKKKTKKKNEVQLKMSKPKKPPESGYLLFHRLRMDKRKKKEPNKPHRILSVEVTAEWDALTKEQQNTYHKKQKELMKIYEEQSEEYALLGYYTVTE